MKARALAANLSVKAYLTGFRQSIFCSLAILVLLVLYFTSLGQPEISCGMVWGYGLSIINFILLSHHLDKYLSRIPRPGRFILNSQIRFIMLIGALCLPGHHGDCHYLRIGH